MWTSLPSRRSPSRYWRCDMPTYLLAKSKQEVTYEREQPRLVAIGVLLEVDGESAQSEATTETETVAAPQTSTPKKSRKNS